MIQDIDDILQRLLLGELSSVPPPEITFSPPENDGVGSLIGVNLYLYDVRENLSLRDAGFEAHLPDKLAKLPATRGRRRSPLWMDLSYIITVSSGENPAADHRLLADVMAVLFRATPIPAAYLTRLPAESCGVAPHLAVAQPDHAAHADPFSLWQALGGRMRPALGLTVTVAFDPFETKWTRVVREAVFAMGPAAPPDRPGRPLDVTAVRVASAGVVVDKVKDAPLSGVTVRVQGREQVTVTDERGFFCLLDLPPGPLTLTFERRGYQAEERPTVAPPPGRSEQLEMLAVTLRPLTDREWAQEQARVEEAARAAGGLVDARRVVQVSLSGRLLLAGGHPAAYVPVRVGAQHTTTDGDGVYCFFDLPPGDQTVFADLPGLGEREVPPEE